MSGLLRVHGAREPARDTGEFPEGAETPPAMSRRELLLLLGANAALAASTGCSRGAPENIVPYVRQPPEVTPGVPSHYATTMSLGGYGTGLVVESHEGRPTKAEGNPLHPASLGALGTLEQASVLSLYDPTRGRAITRDGVPATWRALLDEIAGAGAPGKRVHVLLEPTSSPHLAPLLDGVRRRDGVVHFDAPLARTSAWAGAKLAFGRVVEPRWDFARASVVLALDADFLAVAGTPPAWARTWASTRRLDTARGALSRLYVVEPRLTVTGMSADERLPVRAREVRAVAVSVLAAVNAIGAHEAPGAARTRDDRDAWVRAVARDLHEHRGSSLVVAGDGQPPEVHALAHALNDALGNAGRTVTYGPSPLLEAGETSHGLAALVQAVDAGEVAALVVVGGDPAYTAFADLDLPRRLRSVPVTAYVGLYENATARACRWYVPEAHFLEAWSDARAFDGTASIAQPLQRPSIDGKTAAQVLAALDGRPDATSRELVEARWNTASADASTPPWQDALVRGVVGEGAMTGEALAVDRATLDRALAVPPAPPDAAAGPSLEIVFYADAKVHDGRFANSAWLQELGDPVTKLAWDNAALLSPATATSAGVKDEEVVSLEVRGRTVRAPALVVPGMADGVVALALGYGQTIPDRVSTDAGADAYAVRDASSPWFDDVTLHATGDRRALAFTQEHASMEGRPIVLARTLEAFRADPDFAREHNVKRP
ncbi:MAG TPA: oxidoreductase, partial [Polyangiaceae bacterium]|nr:oxidoreductase [Polyangiaceae bacterium]